MRRHRALVVLVLVLAAAFGSLRIVDQAAAPESSAPRFAAALPVSERLTRHLLFVVVDGLRHDIAVDPATMPGFSRGMRLHTSGELWAGKISVTSAAVLTFGTGQRGQIEHVVRNVAATVPPFNSWLENADVAGLRLSLVGDPVWSEMFGAHFVEKDLDPRGVAMDVDFNPKTFSDLRRALARKPDVLVAHFTTPDHQMHVHGVQSRAYREHIRGFDRELFALLSSLGPEWTVIVASDHGAGDSGTHGVDTELQRKGPILAYGPGIRPGVRIGRRIDQADLPPTFAALLGISGPLHGLGHPIVEWLDLPPETAATLSCGEAQRLMRLAAARGQPATEMDRAEAERGCSSALGAERRIAASRAAAARVAADLEESAGLGSPAAGATLIGVLGLLLIATGLTVGRAALSLLPAAAPVLLVAVFLVREVERMPGAWPDAVRAVLFVSLLSPVAGLLLCPGVARSLAGRAPVAAALLVPGCLVMSYTSNTQPLAYVAIGVGLVVFSATGWLAPSRGWVWSGHLRPSRLHAVVLLVAFAALWRVGTVRGWVYPHWLSNGHWLSIPSGMAALVAWAVGEWRRGRIGRDGVRVVVPIAIALASLAIVRVVPPLVGRASIVVTAFIAFSSIGRASPSASLAWGLAAYVWVCRPFEIPVLVALVAFAQAASEALGRAPTNAHRVPTLLVFGALVFSLLFLLRIALGGSLDFGMMDFAVAGFGDPNIPLQLVGSALIWKYLLGALLVLGGAMSALGTAERIGLVRVVLAAYLARAAALLVMLVTCAGSYWTVMRVLLDLPCALLFAAACATTWGRVARDGAIAVP